MKAKSASPASATEIDTISEALAANSVNPSRPAVASRGVLLFLSKRLRSAGAAM